MKKYSNVGRKRMTIVTKDGRRIDLDPGQSVVLGCPVEVVADKPSDLEIEEVGDSGRGRR